MRIIPGSRDNPMETFKEKRTAPRRRVREIGQTGVEMKENMKEKIIALITEILQVPEGMVTENTLMEDLEAWDSVAQVMIIGELESRLGISVPLDEAMEMTGVADILGRL